MPRRISYDNSAIAVIEVLKGRERKLTKEFLRLQSHYLFQEHFCLFRRPNEKGHVERLLGFARQLSGACASGRFARNAQPATPRELPVRISSNRLCGAGLQGRTAPWKTRPSCCRYPSSPSRRGVLTMGTADSQSLVRFDTNDYSVPVKYTHRKLLVVATVEEVRLVYEDRLVARHPRCWQRAQTRFEPIHYLARLERKPGGFDYARPLEQWQLPECFGLLRRRLEAADPRYGTRSYIRVLRQLERFSLPQLTGAVEYALDIDVIDPESIRTIVEHRAEQPVALFSLDGRPHLAQVRVEMTDVAAYGALLTEVSP